MCVTCIAGPSHWERELNRSVSRFKRVIRWRKIRSPVTFLLATLVGFVIDLTLGNLLVIGHAIGGIAAGFLSIIGRPEDDRLSVVLFI